MNLASFSPRLSKSIARSLICSVLFLISIALVAAQDYRAKVQGAVTDASGASL